MEGPLVDPPVAPAISEAVVAVSALQAALPAAPQADPPAPGAAPVQLDTGVQDEIAEVLEYGLNLQLQVRDWYGISDDLSVVWADTAWVVFSSPDIRVNISQMQHDLHVDAGKLVSALCRLGRTEMHVENNQIILVVEKSPAAIDAVSTKLTGIVFHASRPH